MADFVIPDFLLNQDDETIHKRMLDNLPDDIDKSEGGMAWDNTYPTAYEEAYFSEYVLTEAIKMIFPMFCDGYYEIANYHAYNRGLERKSAEYAVGELTITGTDGTEIPSGTEFATVSIDDEESIIFYTTEDAIITDGVITVPIKAATEGTIGNVSMGTIVLKNNNITGIQSVTNEIATSGGTEEESTERLIARIVEYDKTQGSSFVGSVSDYKRWALEVPGTGNAIVIPAQDDSGLVTIVLMDANGNAASTDLCTKVYNHIMSPDNPELKLAPCIGAVLSVVPPTTVRISVAAIVELDGTVSIEDIQTAYLAALKNYMAGEAADEAEIIYTRVCSILSNIPGVKDYRQLTINDGVSNISILSTQLAECESVILTAGEV